MPKITNLKTLQAFKEVLKLKIEVDELQVDKDFLAVKQEIQQFSIINWALNQFDVGRWFTHFLSGLVNSHTTSAPTSTEPKAQTSIVRDIVTHSVEIAADRLKDHLSDKPS